MARQKQSDCKNNELFYQAIRMDESRFLQDTEEGKKILKKYGKIYAVYVWSPDVGVHIASATRSAELWLVDYVPERLYSGGDEAKREKASEKWDAVKFDLMRDSQMVDYMDYSTVKRLAEVKKNVCDIGCYEVEEDRGKGRGVDADARDRHKSAEDAIEHYNGNPCW